MPYRIKFIITVLLFFISGMISTFTQGQPVAKFLAVADIHFDPFIGCDKLSSPCPILSELRTTHLQSWDSIFQKYTNNIKTNYHQDTDYLLLKSTLTELKTLTQQQKPAFIVILGDFLAHKFPEQYKKYSGDKSATGYQIFVKNIFQYLTNKLNQAAPTTNIYPVLGNNDTYSKNYEVVPQGLFLQNSADIFSTLIKDRNNQKEFRREFPKNGYYAITLNNNQRLIVLNSVLFSAMHSTRAMQYATEVRNNLKVKVLSPKLAQSMEYRVLSPQRQRSGLSVDREITRP